MLNVRIRHLRQYVRDIHGVGDSFIFISDKVFGDTRRKMNKDIIPALFSYTINQLKRAELGDLVGIIIKICVKKNPLTMKQHRLKKSLKIFL